MNRMLTAGVVISAVAVSLTRVAAVAEPRGLAETTRTVYFSAMDAKGLSVTDLTAADLTVKEGGKDRAVASLKAATGPIQASILVDDGGGGGFQGGVSQFINATFGHAEYAISMLNPQPFKVANYITDVEGLNAALAKLIQRGRVTQDSEQVIEAVSWAAKELQQRKAARPVILVMTNGGEAGLSENADRILFDLKSSAASLHVVYINGIMLGKVLGDGPKNSGGLSQSAASSQMVTDAVKKVAANLMQQYVLTYTLPDGTKPNERLQLATTRKGVTLLAPTRIKDR